MSTLTQHGTLAIDDNDKPVMGGTSSVDNKTIINSAFDPTTRRLLVDVSGGSTGLSLLIPTAGMVNGVNRTFTFATAPQIVVLDNGTTMNQQNITPDLTVNWTGTTTIVLNQAPFFNIFALG